jgi:hypothetical protein
VRPPQVRGLFGGAPVTVTDAQRRRREVLTLLTVLGGATIVGYLALGGVFAYAALVANGALAMYVMLLVRAQKLAEERYEKVRYLPTAAYDEYELEYDYDGYELESAFAH